MDIENPFESGHIKNYILLYASVVVIMVLFFIATTLFKDVTEVEKKVFDVNMSQVPLTKKPMKNIDEVDGSRFQLMQKVY